MTEFNFSGVESPQSGTEGKKYLTPGMFMLTAISAEFKEVGKNGTPMMIVTFQCSSKNPELNNKMCRGKFWLTNKEGSLARLVYFHKAFFGKTITKVFKSPEEIVDYFDKVFKSEPGQKVKKPVLVGGEITNNQVYTDLPYTDYVLPENEFEEGEFEINSSRFKRVIASDTKTIVSEDAPNTEDDFIAPNSSSKKEEAVADDLPF